MTAPVPDHAARTASELTIGEPTVAGPHFWSTRRDDETLHHTEVEEAAWRCIEDQSEGTESLADTIKRIAPLTVYGFTRDQVTDADLARHAEWATERICELLDEQEYGDPNGDHHVLKTEGADLVEAAIRDALTRARARGQISPWTCHESEQRTLTEAELLEMFEGCS